MTVIAWDGKYLAADRRATAQDTLTYSTRKIEKGKNGELLATVGDADAGRAMIEWRKGKGDFPTFPEDCDVELIVITKAKKILIFGPRFEQPIEIFDKFMAWGSGRGYAMACMALGLRADEAVIMASRFDPGCGGGVDMLYIDEKANKAVLSKPTTTEKIP